MGHNERAVTVGKYDAGMHTFPPWRMGWGHRVAMLFKPTMGAALPPVQYQLYCAADYDRHMVLPTASAIAAQTSTGPEWLQRCISLVFCAVCRLPHDAAVCCTRTR